MLREKCPRAFRTCSRKSCRGSSLHSHWQSSEPGSSTWNHSVIVRFEDINTNPKPKNQWIITLKDKDIKDDKIPLIEEKQRQPGTSPCLYYRSRVYQSLNERKPKSKFRKHCICYKINYTYITCTKFNFLQVGYLLFGFKTLMPKWA